MNGGCDRFSTREWFTKRLTLPITELCKQTVDAVGATPIANGEKGG